MTAAPPRENTRTTIGTPGGVHLKNDSTTEQRGR